MSDVNNQIEKDLDESIRPKSFRDDSNVKHDNHKSNKSNENSEPRDVLVVKDSKESELEKEPHKIKSKKLKLKAIEEKDVSKNSAEDKENNSELKKSKNNKSRNIHKTEWCKYFAYLNDDKREKLFELPEFSSSGNISSPKKRKSRNKINRSKSQSASTQRENKDEEKVENDLKNKSTHQILKVKEVNKKKTKKSDSLRSNESSGSSSNISNSKKNSKTKIKKILTDNSDEENQNNNSDGTRSSEINKKSNKSEYIINTDSDGELETKKPVLNSKSLSNRSYRRNNLDDSFRKNLDSADLLRSIVSAKRAERASMFQFDQLNNYAYAYDKQLIKGNRRDNNIQKSLTNLIKSDVDSSIEFNKIKNEIERCDPTVDFNHVAESLQGSATYKNLMRSMAANLKNYNKIRNFQTKITFCTPEFYDKDSQNSKLRSFIRSPYD